MNNYIDRYRATEAERILGRHLRDESPTYEAEWGRAITELLDENRSRSDYFSNVSLSRQGTHWTQAPEDILSQDVSPYSTWQTELDIRTNSRLPWRDEMEELIQSRIELEQLLKYLDRAGERNKKILLEKGAQKGLPPSLPEI